MPNLNSDLKSIASLLRSRVPYSEFAVQNDYSKLYQLTSEEKAKQQKMLNDLDEVNKNEEEYEKVVLEDKPTLNEEEDGPTSLPVTSLQDEVGTIQDIATTGMDFVAGVLQLLNEMGIQKSLLSTIAIIIDNLPEPATPSQKIAIRSVMSQVRDIERSIKLPPNSDKDNSLTQLRNNTIPAVLKFLGLLLDNDDKMLEALVTDVLSAQRQIATEISNQTTQQTPTRSNTPLKRSKITLKNEGRTSTTRDDAKMKTEFKDVFKEEVSDDDDDNDINIFEGLKQPPYLVSLAPELVKRIRSKTAGTANPKVTVPGELRKPNDPSMVNVGSTRWFRLARKAVKNKIPIGKNGAFNVAPDAPKAKVRRQKGQGLKMASDGTFGKLRISLPKLKQMKLHATKDGKKVGDGDLHPHLYDLLTKRYNPKKKYNPQAMKDYKHLVMLAELSVADNKSGKGKLVQGRIPIRVDNDPKQLKKKALRNIGLIKQGNNAPELVEELSELLNELKSQNVIDDQEYLSLSKDIF